jgi:hypothetical protein
MAGATLRFQFPGDQAVVDRGRWRQDGREMSAELALGPGRSVRLPFTAKYPRENPLPLSFLVDGVLCEAVVTGPRGVQLVGEESSDKSGPGPDNAGPGPGKKKKKKHEDRGLA